MFKKREMIKLSSNYYLPSKVVFGRRQEGRHKKVKENIANKVK